MKLRLCSRFTYLHNYNTQNFEFCHFNYDFKSKKKMENSVFTTNAFVPSGSTNSLENPQKSSDM